MDMEITLFPTNRSTTDSPPISNGARHKKNHLLIMFAVMATLLFGKVSAQIAQRGATTSAEVNNSTTIGVNKPTGVVTNDIMIAVLSHSNTSSSAMAAATATGWTLINSSQYASSGNDRWRLTILYKIAVAGDAASSSYSFNLQAGTRDGTGAIIAFSGIDTANPFDVTATTNSGASTAITATGLTSVTNNAVIMMIAGVAAQQPVTSWTATSPATLNEVLDSQDNAGADQSIAAAIGTKLTAGATGNGIGALAASRSWTATMLALRPVTVTTGSISGSPFCPSGAVSVPYTITGPYNANNTFSAQLSDASGSFASPTQIGSLTNTNVAGTISATIPAAQVAGTGYRIRVVSSSPAATGVVNTVDLTIASITANAGTAVTICETTTSVNITAGATASGQTSVLWTSSGTGTFADANSLTLATYTPSAADILAGSVTLTLTASGTCPVSANKTLTINKVPTATAGGSATTCVNQPVAVSGATAANGTILWTENGFGSVTAGATTLTPTYTPAAGDIGVPVTLTMTVSNASCIAATATFTVNVNALATAAAGTAVTTCSNSGAVNITAGSTATNNSGVTWTSSGTGTFTNANSLTLAAYTPSAADITAGTVTLTLTATGNAPCANATSNKTLTINAQAVANAGADIDMCASATSVNMAGSRSGFGVTTSTWGTSGTGTFSSATNLTASYTPSALDKTNGGVTITLTTNDPAGPCGVAVDTMLLNIFPVATATAGANQTVCAGGSINISGSVNGGASSGSWSAPSGSFGNAGNLSTTYTPSITSGTVLLTLTTDNPTGPCGAVTSTLTVTVNPSPTISGVSQAAAVCENTNATINLAGLIAGSTSNVTYTVNNGSPVTVNGIIADGSGNASFSVNVTLANNGQALAITNIHRTDLAVTCDSVPVANNTVSLQVNANTTYYEDADSDGFGNPAVTSLSCLGAPVGFVADNTDCDDTDDTKHTTYEFYLDNDGDTYGAGTAVMLCAVDANTPPTAEYVVNNTDCDDADNTKHATFDFYADTDNDGYGASTSTSLCAVDANTPPTAGFVSNGDDCNDTNASVHPFATEVGYNLIDDDCDGSVDEGFPPKVTQLQGPFCNTTLSTIDTQIVANLVAGAQGYRWRVTALNGPNAGLIQTLDTNLRVMKFTQLPNYAFGTQYQVMVAVYYAGFLQPYTNACNVTTPSAGSQLANCGATLSLISDAIYANLVPYAAGYRFRITDPLNPLNTQEINRPIRDCKMIMITNYIVQYGKTYNVEVAIKNTDGTYMPYGTVCSVTTPVFPTTSLQESQCDDYIVPANNTALIAISHPGAIAYAFWITGPGLGPLGMEVVRTTRTVTLSDFGGLTPGETYNVKIRIIFHESDPAGPYGKTCTVIAPGLSRAAVKTEKDFNAVVYPNPFADSFNIALTSSLSDDAIVKVYDMTGRLLENKTFKSAETQDINWGKNYPSGVYNVVVNQGEETKTLRVIKR
jgi:hypothetical protein